MCGIFGAITKNVESTLLKGLEYVEYRGYDSSGMCVLTNNRFLISKSIGEISNLKRIVSTSTPYGSGIAHTRWATTGKVSIENTHPFFSPNGNITLVHNGIIENADDIKSSMNTNFVSETDSEVIAHMLNDFDGISTSFIDIFNTLKGSFAVCFLHKSHPNTLYVAKRSCPLYISKSGSNIYVASDPICFLPFSTSYYTLADDEFGILSVDNLTFYNKQKECINKSQTSLVIDKNYISTLNYSTHMLQEIYDISYVLDTINNRNLEENQFENIKEIICKYHIKNIALIGCGTAYHSCCIGATYLSKISKIKARAYISSEFIYESDIYKDTLYIFISQSGETLDTLNVLKDVKKMGIPIVTITNSGHSTMASISDIVIDLKAGKEFAVASTKSFVAQVYVLYRLSNHLIDKYVPNITINKSTIDSLNHSKNLIELISKYKKIFFLGRGNDYYIAKEASLKIRETCYLPTFDLNLGELKHGPLALIDRDALCIVFSTNNAITNKNLTSINEIIARGGNVITVSNMSLNTTQPQVVYHISLPSIENVDLCSIIPFQILSNDLSIHLNHNPDKPRNLAKSVTVE